LCAVVVVVVDDDSNEWSWKEKASVIIGIVVDIVMVMSARASIVVVIVIVAIATVRNDIAAPEEDVMAQPGIFYMQARDTGLTQRIQITTSMFKVKVKAKIEPQ